MLQYWYWLQSQTLCDSRSMQPQQAISSRPEAEAKAEDGAMAVAGAKAEAWAEAGAGAEAKVEAGALSWKLDFILAIGLMI